MYRSGPRNAMERIGRPLGDPPTLSTVWFCGVGLIMPGLTMRLIFPFFRKPTYNLPSGPNAVDVGRSPASPAFGATWVNPANGLKFPNWLRKLTTHTPPPPKNPGWPLV